MSGVDCESDAGVCWCGMLRFLYSQLLEFASGSQNTVIEKSSSGKLRVKPDVQFHLYISTAPCGDGALFSPRCVCVFVCKLVM